MLITEVAKFLGKFNPRSELPIPIAEIVEFDLGIEIVPLAGLERDFEICASITADLSRIYVDDKTLRNNEGRYRFSLAHEVAHLLLHRCIFSSVAFDSVTGWKSFVQTSIAHDEYVLMERQCNRFAGLALVPTVELKRELSTAKLSADRAFPLGNDARRAEFCLAELMKKFCVTRDPITIRMEEEHLTI